MSVSFSFGLILCLAGQAAPQQGQSPATPRLQPPNLAAQALADPPEHPLGGEPWTLSRALSAPPDRMQQQATARAYWQLVEAAAKYNFARDLSKKMKSLLPRPGDDAVFRAAQSAVLARRREAELAAIEAQYALAALLRLPSQSALPWPADPPHVGGYRTNYAEMSRRGTLPERSRLIDRLLPLQCSIIEVRNHAVAAAEDSLASAEAIYQAGQADLGTVVAAAEKRYRQQAAFIETACRYNRDIAEYACTAAPPGLPATQLSSWMIQAHPNRAAAPGASRDSAVQPAEHMEPMPMPEILPRGGQPTPAIPKAGRLVPLEPEQGVSPVIAHEPTPARTPRPTPNFQPETPAIGEPAKTEPKTPDRDPFSAKTPATVPPLFQGDNRILSPESSAPTPSENRDSPPEEKTSTASPRVVRKEFLEPPASLNWSGGESAPANPSAGPGSSALYAALQQAEPAVQAKQLTLLLHGSFPMPRGAGRPMSLEACLSSLPGGDRKAALDAYWTARQRAAEYRVLAEQRSFLDKLTPSTPAGPPGSLAEAEALQLRTIQLEAQADLLESQARLVEAQYALARQTQATAAADWPLPTTAPHFGPYTMSFKEQPRRITGSWPMRRLAAAIPQYDQCLQGHAASIVAADSARSDAVAKYEAARGTLADVLDRTAAQTRHTLEFLQTQADYNRAIADYALAVLPSDTPSAKLVEDLVVKP